MLYGPNCVAHLASKVGHPSRSGFFLHIGIMTGFRAPFKEAVRVTHGRFRADIVRDSEPTQGEPTQTNSDFFGTYRAHEEGPLGTVGTY